MDKWGIGWDGQVDITPNGDFYRVEDVFHLEDENERLRNQVAQLKSRETVSEVFKPAPAPETAKGVFGYANARQAGLYLSGRRKIITLSRRRSVDMQFPVYFNDMPSQFYIEGGKDMPGLRTFVKTPEGLGRVSSYSKNNPGCINVKLMRGPLVLVESWERVTDARKAIAEEALSREWTN